MAQLQLQPISTGKRKHRSLASLKIDMTPLVDLGFLLITFFIFTTTMARPMITKLYMPADGDRGDLGKSSALTVLLAGENKVYCYEGRWEEALKNKRVRQTSYDVQTGIGKIIRQKQKSMDAKKRDLMLLIKPLENASYKNVIDALDETTINSVTRYAIMDPAKEESNYVNTRQNKLQPTAQ